MMKKVPLGGFLPEGFLLRAVFDMRRGGGGLLR